MSRLKKKTTTKEILLKEGMQQLAEHGYHGTGIKKILDAANIPKGSFYNYFDSKEDYVSQIVNEYNRQSLAMFDKLILESEVMAIEKLEILYGHMLTKYADANYRKGCLIGNMAAEIGHSFERCQKAMQISVNNWLIRLTNLLTQAQHEGSIRADLKPEILAEILWSAWEGALLKMQMDGNHKVAERVLEALFKQLLMPHTP